MDESAVRYISETLRRRGSQLMEEYGDRFQEGQTLISVADALDHGLPQAVPEEVSQKLDEISRRIAPAIEPEL